MKRWLKRLAWLVLIVVAVVVVVLIAPVGRYVGLAIEDETFAKAEKLRRQQPAPHVPVPDAPTCLEGTVTLSGAPAAKVAVSAGHPRRPQAICGLCLDGCDCDAALEASWHCLPTSLPTTTSSAPPATSRAAFACAGCGTTRGPFTCGPRARTRPATWWRSRGPPPGPFGSS